MSAKFDLSVFALTYPLAASHEAEG